MNDNEIGQNSAQITINTANITKNAFDIAYGNPPEGKYFCFVDEEYIYFLIYLSGDSNSMLNYNSVQGKPK